MHLPDALPAICIRQPWASLTAMSVLDRHPITWPLDHRGPLAIHANGRDGYTDATAGWNELVATVALGRIPLSFPLPQAAVIAIVEVDECRPVADGVWELQMSAAVRPRRPLFMLGRPELWMWRPPAIARDAGFWQHSDDRS